MNDITPEWEAEMAERMNQLTDEMHRDRLRREGALSLIELLSAMMSDNTPLGSIDRSDLPRARQALGALEQLADHYRALLEWAERLVNGNQPS